MHVGGLVVERWAAVAVVLSAAAAVCWLEHGIAALDAELARRASVQEGLRSLADCARHRSARVPNRRPLPLQLAGHRFTWNDSELGSSIAPSLAVENP